MLYFPHLRDNFCVQSYLLRTIPQKFRRCITAYIDQNLFLLSIESGRYKTIARNKRRCTFCNHNDIEDVFHFVLTCPLYNSLRSRYIQNYYVKKPTCSNLTSYMHVFSSNKAKFKSCVSLVNIFIMQLCSEIHGFSLSYTFFFYFNCYIIFSISCIKVLKNLTIF